MRWKTANAVIRQVTAYAVELGQERALTAELVRSLVPHANSLSIGYRCTPDRIPFSRSVASGVADGRRIGIRRCSRMGMPRGFAAHRFMESA